MADNREHPIIAAQFQHQRNGSDGSGNPTIDTITSLTCTKPILVFFILKLSNESSRRTLGHITIFIDTNLDLYLFYGLVCLALNNNEYLNYDQPDKAEFNIMDFKHDNTVTKVHYENAQMPDKVVRTDEEMRAAVALLRDRGWSGFDRFEIWFNESHLPVSMWKKLCNFFKREKKDKKYPSKGKGKEKEENVSGGPGDSSAAGTSTVA